LFRYGGYDHDRSYQAFFSSLLALYRAWDDDRRKPTLEFYRRDDRTSPYFEEVRNEANGARTRLLRVGLRNTGEIDLPRVWLILEACSINLPAVHLEARLRPMGHQPGDSEFIVAAQGTTVIDVLIENVPPGQEYGVFSFAYSLSLADNTIPNPQEPIQITLRAEGGGLPRRCSLHFGNRLSNRLGAAEPL
jgi:hypothetical protein